MKLVNRRSRTIRKSVKKVVKKHGAKIAAGLAGGIASALATLASTDAPGTQGKQTNLGKVSERLTDHSGLKKEDAQSGGVGLQAREKGKAREKVEGNTKGGRSAVVTSEEGIISDRVRELLRGPKDAALGFAARTALNTRFSRIGEMTELSVDTKNKSLRLRVDLVGESEPLRFRLRSTVSNEKATT